MARARRCAPEPPKPGPITDGVKDLALPPEPCSRPSREVTPVDHRGGDLSRSPGAPDESYRVSETLTEADKKMIDFLIERAFEAWQRNR